jgi:tetratricopeptide (TPR) repeat protein
VTPNPPAPVPTKEVDDDKDLPKRLPQASTCTAFGDFHLQAGLDPEHAPGERERLLDQARRAYQQALKLDANSKDAYHGLARTYDELKDHGRAVTTYQNAIKAFPQDGSFHFELGMCQARLKQWDPALENLTVATQLDPENRVYINTLAFTLARAGHYDDSVACFQKTVGEAQGHYNVARVLHHVKQDELGKQHLRQALVADPKLTAAQQLLDELEHPGAVAARPAAAVGFEAADDPVPGVGTKSPTGSKPRG